MVMVMAIIYTLCERYEEAIDEIEYVLSLETDITVNTLKFLRWTVPLRNIPRYQEILSKYSLHAGI